MKLSISNTGGPSENIGVELKPIRGIQIKQIKLPKNPFMMEAGSKDTVEIKIEVKENVGPKTVNLDIDLVDKKNGTIGIGEFCPKNKIETRSGRNRIRSQ